MQRLTSRLRRRRPAVLDASAARRRELRFGLVGALVLVIGLIAVAVVYVIPIGQRVFTADLSEAQSVRVGDDVRLAGIPVGKVKSLDLKPDRVVMRFTVRSDVFLGDQTSLDIRMLTVVGGHYLALIPAGAKPLGNKTIPADRVRLPYSLMEAFQDAEQPTRAIDGDTLRQNLGAMATSLENAPNSLHQMLNGVEQFVDILDRQRADVSKAVSLTDEYLNSLDLARGQLHRLIDKVNLLETLLVDHRAELRQAVEALDRVVSRIGGLEPAWESTLKPMAQQLSSAATELKGLGDRLEPLINQVNDLGATLQKALLPDGQVQVDQSSATVVGAPGLDLTAGIGPVCIPVPGKGC